MTEKMVLLKPEGYDILFVDWDYEVKIFIKEKSNKYVVGGIFTPELLKVAIQTSIPFFQKELERQKQKLKEYQEEHKENKSDWLKAEIKRTKEIIINIEELLNTLKKAKELLEKIEK